MPRQVDITNRALAAISARSTVSSIAPPDGSNEANNAALLFQPTFEMLGRAAFWNIFRKQAALTVLKAAAGTPENPGGATLPIPPSPWLYAYAYPTDCLMARFLLPSLGNPAIGGAPLSGLGWAPTTGTVPTSPFVVAADTDTLGNPIRTILTNLDRAQMVYTVNLPDPDQWDSGFQEAMVAALGAKLVPALTGNLTMMQLQIGIATRIVGEARKSDGNEGLTIVDPIPDWIRIRGTGWLSQWPGAACVAPFGGLYWPV